LLKILNTKVETLYTLCLSLIIISHFGPLPKLTNLFICILCFVWIFIDNGFKKKIEALKANRLALLFIAFSLLNLIGLLYSENIKEALFLAERRSSLFIFPIILGSISISPKNVKKILFTVVISCFLNSFIGIGYSLTKYISMGNGDVDVFFNDNLLVLFKMQAVYFAFFTNVSIFITIYLLHGGFFKRTFIKYLAAFLIVWFVLINFLLASRLSIIMLYFTGISFLFIYLFHKKQWKTLLTSGGIIILGLISFISFPSNTLNRFKAISNTEYNYENTNPINHHNNAPKTENWNGLNIRFAIWTCALEKWKERPLIGFGSGDVQQALRDQYTANKFHKGLDENYNTHNQYLDFGLSFGLIGLIVLLSILILPGIHAFKTENYLYIAFVLLFATSMLTENMLNRNMGIVFYSLLNCLLAFHLKPTKA